MNSKTAVDMSRFSLSCGLRSARLMMLSLAIGLALLVTAGPVAAASSEWAVNEGGRMRLILLPETGDGVRHGALVIEPKPGWITYWKEPGDVGIPPAITPAPGVSYTVDSVGFPVPKVLMNGDMIDVGYDHPVTLPLTLRLSTTRFRPVVPALRPCCTVKVLAVRMRVPVFSSTRLSL